MATAEAWRRELVNTQATDAQIKRALNDMARHAEGILRRAGGTTFSADVRQAQLGQAMAALRELQGEFFGKLTPILESGMQEAISIGTEAMTRLDEGLVGNARSILKYPYMQASRNNIENLRSRLLLDINLSSQVYRTRALADRWVANTVNRGILAGKSSKEIAADVRQFIRPDVKGGVSYASMRLGRTELNNSFHATTVRSMQGRPWIEGVEWHLSGSHPRLDICNELHSRSPWPRDDVPMKPHPQCLCFVTASTPSQSEFINRLNNGEFDDWMDENNGWNFTDSDLVGTAEDVKNRLIQYRIDGKSWAEIAKLESLGSPGAARHAFTKYTGSTDYKTKGTSLKKLFGGQAPSPTPVPHISVPMAEKLPSPVRIRSQLHSDLIKKLHDMPGVDIEDIDKLDDDTLQGVVNAFDKFVANHPALKVHLSGVDMGDSTSAAITSGQVGELRTVDDMRLNLKYFGDRDALLKAKSDCYASDWWVKAGYADPGEEVTTHELGHVLARSLSYDEQKDCIDTARYLADVIYKHSDLPGLSGQAQKSGQELLAEAFAWVKGPTQAPPWANKAVEKMEEYYEKRYVVGFAQLDSSMVTRIRGISQAAHHALSSYTGSGYRVMNQFMRTGDIPRELSYYHANIASIRSNVDLMKQVTRSYRTEADTYVWRGVGSGRHLNLIPGQTFTDRGFVSTSSKREVSMSFQIYNPNQPRPTMLKILMPKGTYGYHVGGYESEWILPNDTTFLVERIDPGGVVVCRVIRQTAGPVQRVVRRTR